MNHHLLHEPIPILYIIRGCPGDKELPVFRIKLFEFSSRRTPIDPARLEDGIFEHDGTRGYNDMLLHYGQIHHNGAHAYQYFIFDGAAMHDRIVPYRNIIADDRLRFFKRAVDHCAVLDIDPVTNAYGIDIAAHDSTPPYGAIVAHDDVTDDDCIVGEETTPAEGRVYVVKGTDVGHNEVKKEE